MVCDMIVSDGPEGVPAKMLDVTMLAVPGGRERTRGEFATLFEKAGLELRSITETRSPICVLEGVPFQSINGTPTRSPA